ncbi:hypothetical protein THAOC_15076, partial [Thalassiosira oceanica]
SCFEVGVGFGHELLVDTGGERSPSQEPHGTEKNDRLATNPDPSSSFESPRCSSNAASSRSAASSSNAASSSAAASSSNAASARRTRPRARFKIRFPTVTTTSQIRLALWLSFDLSFDLSFAFSYKTSQKPLLVVSAAAAAALARDSSPLALGVRAPTVPSNGH